MAQRRMFSKDITGTDAFLEMPVSSQLLYFHLGMEADDDGFVGSPKKISRVIGAGEDDLKILSAKRFILTFPTGVVVIKHWKINNYIQNDRYHETKYLPEKSAIITKKNGAYTECIQDASKMDTEARARLELEQGKVIIKKKMKNKKYFLDILRKEKGLPPMQYKFSENQWDFFDGSKLIPLFKKAVIDTKNLSYWEHPDDIADLEKENSRINGQIKIFWKRCDKNLEKATAVINWYSSDYGKWKNWSPGYCFRKDTVVDYENRSVKKGKTLRELTKNL